MKSRSKVVLLLGIVTVMIIGMVVLPYDVVQISEIQTDNTSPFNIELASSGLGDLPRVVPYWIDEDSDFVDFGFPGSGTPEDPYIIEGVEILTNDTALACIHVTEEVDAWFVIRNCRLMGVGGGVFVDDANFTLSGCEISGGEQDCVYTRYSNAIITNNVVESSWMAVKAQYCYSLTIQCNIISDADWGIHVSVMGHATIESNMIHNCTIGIEIGGDNHLVKSNKIFNCSTGIFCSGTHHLRVFYNVFYQNSLNAKDMSTGGIWDYGNGTIITLENWWDDNVSMGNYWDDCIMDTPYETGVYGVDNYPVLYELEPPIIEHFGDYDIYQEDNKTLIWNATDDTPSIYKVYLDGSIFQSDTWNGNPITIDLSDVEIGEYNITLYLQDLNGNSANDSAVLTVHESTISETETIPIETLSLVGAGAIVGAIVVGVVVLKKRP